MCTNSNFLSKKANIEILIKYRQIKQILTIHKKSKFYT